jgi:hypothetical protein
VPALKRYLGDKRVKFYLFEIVALLKMALTEKILFKTAIK